MFALWKSLVVCLPSETGQMARARALLSRGSRARGFYLETNYAELKKTKQKQKKSCMCRTGSVGRRVEVWRTRTEERCQNVPRNWKHLALCLKKIHCWTFHMLGNQASMRSCGIPEQTPIFRGVGEAPSPFVTSHEEFHFPKRKSRSKQKK